MPRLFVAVEVPDDVVAGVEGAIAPLKTAAPGLRWVGMDRYHLTLVFLGRVEDESVAAVRDAVGRAAELAGAPVPLALTGRLGTFRGGVLWAELADSPELATLAGHLAHELRSVVDLPDGDRPFRAHLTLARAPRGSRIRRDLTDATVPAGSWTVRRVVLMESKLGRGGSTYTVDTAWPLV